MQNVQLYFIHGESNKDNKYNELKNLKDKISEFANVAIVKEINLETAKKEQYSNNDILIIYSGDVENIVKEVKISGISSSNIFGVSIAQTGSEETQCFHRYRKNRTENNISRNVNDVNKYIIDELKSTNYQPQSDIDKKSEKTVPEVAVPKSSSPSAVPVKPLMNALCGVCCFAFGAGVAKGLKDVSRKAFAVYISGSCIAAALGALALGIAIEKQ